MALLLCAKLCRAVNLTSPLRTTPLTALASIHNFYLGVCLFFPIRNQFGPKGGKNTGMLSLEKLLCLSDTPAIHGTMFLHFSFLSVQCRGVCQDFLLTSPRPNLLLKRFFSFVFFLLPLSFTCFTDLGDSQKADIGLCVLVSGAPTVDQV